jgi:metallo-beta-lactamase family protein
MRIQFLGAAEDVTGSSYYIETENTKFLVDCGQFQGSPEDNKKNNDLFPFDAKDIDFVILTHAHIDHTGRLPKLVKEGFAGKVFMTRGTASLSELLLQDSAKIHEHETEIENAKRKKAGLDLVEPYYEMEDVYNTLQYFYPLTYEQEHTEGHINFRLINAGHLLGSAHIYLEFEGKSFLFSGDIGTQHSDILLPPKAAVQADYIIMENTYGLKAHQNIQNRFKMLYDAIMETINSKGTVIIPAFSVGRTQDILYGLKHMSKSEGFDKIPIYVDSPMAIHATRIFTKDLEGMKEEVIKEIEEGHRPFDMNNVTFIDDAEVAYRLNFNRNPKILISAAGMCDAGRIVPHLQTFLPYETTTVFFVGYQAETSIGRKIQNKEALITLIGKDISHNANVVTLSGFSGHADHNELLDWLSHSKPKEVILVHGEPESLQHMAQSIQEKYGFKTRIPKRYDIFEL